jgi:hypothetical protein
MSVSEAPTTERATRFQYCPRCEKRRKMRVLRDLDDTGLSWLNCLACNGIVCCEHDPDDDGTIEVDVVGTFGDPAPDTYRTYVPEGTYEIGEFIYHQTWRDVGKVIRRQELAGGRSAIEVAFLSCGLKILIVEAEVPAR